VVAGKQSTLTLVASTSIGETHARTSGPDEAEAATVIRQLKLINGPCDFEALPDEWAAILRRCHPDEFHKGCRRICVPLTAAGELQGFLILGDRVGGALFGPQEFDLLQAIAGHVASGLLNLQLSQQLLQTREHEAFQTMATFFVHDLKNAATTLNLMLQNLPEHFDDPAFRDDALRGVGKTVAHINNLISRLSQLRQETKISPASGNLNELIKSVISQIGQAGDIRLDLQLGEIPPVLFDHSQLTKVFTNLLINAREAMGSPGTLGITTSVHSGDWVVVSISDTGCGMTREFMVKSLFRPFQTTKKNGLGIGMFQSKLIVEAHGGCFGVESIPGRGTTFKVYLPQRTPATR
jgi:putative PEP-CTERM system histidine kinase